MCNVFFLLLRPEVLLERHRKIGTLHQWLIFEGARDNSFLKLLTLKKGIKLLSRSLPLFDKVDTMFNIILKELLNFYTLIFFINSRIFQNQSSTLLLLVVQHVALLTKKEIQQELVKGLEVPIVQCLKACDLESLVVLSQMLMMQADNKVNIAANALQIEVCTPFWFHYRFINHFVTCFLGIHKTLGIFI